MLNTIKELFSLLTPAQKRKIYLFQVLVIIMAMFEVLAIASIAPFMALVSNIELLDGDGFLAQMFINSGLENKMDFLFLIGLGVLLMLILSSLTSIFTYRKLALFGASLGVEMADRLYKYYIEQDWLFHTSTTSAQLTKQISVEAQRVSSQVIQSLLQMNARVVLVLFIAVAIFVYNPIVSISGLALFSLAYFIVFKTVKKRLEQNGQDISDISTERFRLMNEAFGGIKDLLVLGRKHIFINSFEETGKTLARASSSNLILGHLPRYIMELIAIGGMIVLILVMVKVNSSDTANILPMLAVFGLAAFKLMPALQNTYHYVTVIKSNLAAYATIREDLFKSSSFNVDTTPKLDEKISCQRTIQLQNLNFTYPKKSDKAIDNLSLDIHAQQSIGIVGSSGSGKTTLVDIILGLITPQSGKFLVDDTVIDHTNIHQWQKSIGFVSQSIFLTEGTIAENIAFGLRPDQINPKRVERAAKLSHLHNFIDDLAEGFQTRVGERGVQLSGGQRQRIGIARALYHDSEILIFDEATSALDGITENIIMQAINDFQGSKTIIMIAHRLKTIQDCDQIFFIERGKVVDKGTFDQLLESNPKFAEMSKHA